MEALASVEQADRFSDDPWRELIETWCDNPGTGIFLPDGLPEPLLSNHERVLTTEILEFCVGKSKAQWTGNGTGQGDAQRVAKVLRAMGWTRGKHETLNGHRVRFYHRPPGSPRS